MLRYEGSTGAFVDVFAQSGLNIPTYLVFRPSDGVPLRSVTWGRVKSGQELR